MSLSRLSLLCGVLSAVPVLTNGQVTYAQAVQNASAPRRLTIVTSSSPLPFTTPVVAWAKLNDSIPSIGWAVLEVHTSPQGSLYSDEEQAYAAGYLEGAITVQRSFEYLSNSWGNQTFDNGLGKFLMENIDYVHKEVESNRGDAYWHQVGLTYLQMEAMYDGYIDFAPPQQNLTFLQYYSSTLQGDLHDLNIIYSPNASKAQTASVDDDGHCSLLVKPIGPVDAPTELYFSHTTWSHYESMTRFYKMYDLPWSLTGDASQGFVPAQQMAFSSYPAAVFSGDDWYITSTSLAIAETTLANNNPQLWAYVNSSLVLEWARNMVANRLASSASQWAEIFSKYNSGTYNNMWHVVDYKLFSPGEPLADNLFWVLEQMPGPYIVTYDHTDYLRNNSYWASYNRVADPFLFNISGQWQLVQEYGNHFTYNLTSRAEIFKRDQSKVVDEDSLQKLMRYNDFQNDPLAVQGCQGGIPSASNAIACRGELTNQNAICVPQTGFRDEAATDAKYITYAMIQQGGLPSMTQAGPTHDTQAPFQWSTSPLSYLPHAGMPDVWDFPWVPIAFDIPTRR